MIMESIMALKTYSVAHKCVSVNKEDYLTLEPSSLLSGGQPLANSCLFLTISIISHI